MTSPGAFFSGIAKRNPVFVLMLGLCPTLAVTTSAKNALGMGAAAVFVLVFSNLLISLLRPLIPRRIRIPCFIVIIAAFVSIVEMLLKAYLPVLDRSLGIYVPLIVVNCIILGRAEAFASRNPPGVSLADGLGMGIGFTLALLMIGSIRELLGANTIMGYTAVPGLKPALIMILPPGAFLTIGFLLALFNLRKKKPSGSVLPEEAKR